MSLATEIDLDAGVLQHLGQPLPLAGALPDELLAVPGPLPQRRHLRARDEAGPQQPVFMQLGDPLAVRQVRLAARDVAHVRRVVHAHLDPGAGQGVIDRPPVHPGAFHRRVGHAQLRQPAGHLLQRPPERLEPPHGHRALTRPLPGQPDRHPDHLLMHIDPGYLRMDDLHRQPPYLPPYWIRARRPRSPRQDQDPVTRARSSNPGYLPGRLQRQSSKQARSAKVERRQRAAQPKFHPSAGATKVA